MNVPASPSPKFAPTAAVPDATASLSAENGVLMFAYTPALPLGYLNAYSIQQVRTGQPIAGVQMQRNAVETLLTAPSRVLHQLQAQSTLFPAPADAADHTFRHVSERAFDWASNEGLLYCKTIGIMSHKALAIMQRIPHPIPLHMFEGISQLNMEAKRQGYYVLMFAHFDDEDDAVRFRDVTSELFDVAVCEPDPLSHAAFSIRSSTAESGLLVGPQDIMVQVGVEDGRHNFLTEAFIAAQISDRVMLKMRRDGDSLAQIGVVMELNKSSVKRRLDKMHPLPPAKGDDGWRKTYASLLDLPPRRNRLFDIPG
ncbi:hypothetical protein [Variovorax atrisoli]|uniref:hypothetical protein n=1 Tax=Variovorax atrisoli TaxID=3394203 RepID=UPI0012FD094C|nr:hypothetical protein [Variovorax paradoxus]